MEELSKDIETLGRNMSLQAKDLNPTLNNRTCKLFYHEIRVEKGMVRNLYHKNKILF